MTSTTPWPAQRGDEEELYRRHAARLIAATARSVRASHALIEDACSYAWEQVLRHQPEREHLEGWLRMVAARRALELLRADRRLTSLEALPERQARHDQPESALEFRAALDAIAAAGLSRRQERLLGLSAAGHSHAEMVALTGETPRALERQLYRARRRIWQARGVEPPSGRIGPSPGLRAA